MKCKYKGETCSEIKVVCTELGTGTQYSPVAICSVHNRCLPTFRPNKDLYQKWLDEFKPESQYFKICLYCENFSE